MNPVDFLSGAVTFAYVLAGLFFLRFWRRTGDMLFVAFAVAFGLMAANQVGFSLYGSQAESAGWIYLLRVAAYVLIIIAIVGKNLQAERRKP